MKRRILAWVLLAGFILLLLNVMFFKFHWQLSMIIYLIIAFAFILYNGRMKRMQEAEKMNNRNDGKNNGNGTNTCNGSSAEADNDTGGNSGSRNNK